MIQDTPWTPPFVSTTSATAASTGEAITGTSTTKFVTPAALAGSVPTLAAPVRNALAPRGGLAFNGSLNARVTSTLTNQNVNTDVFSLVSTFKMPTASQDFGMCHYIGSTGTSVGNISAAWWLTGDNIRIYFRDGNSGYAEAYVMGARSAFSGKVVTAALIRNASGNPTFYLNGVAQTLSSVSLSAATWQMSITSTYMGLGYTTGSDVCSTTIYSATVYNLALSQSDVTEICELGGAVPERFKFGSQVKTYTSDYSANEDGWVVDSPGVITGNIDAINGQNDWLKVERAVSAYYVYSRKSGLTAGKTAKQLLFSSRVFIPAGSPISYVNIWWNNGGTGGVGAAIPVSPNTQYDISQLAYIPEVNVDLVGIRACDASGAPVSLAAGTYFYQKNFTAAQVGAVCHYDADADGIGYQLHDQGTNKLDAVITPDAASWTKQARRGFVRGTLTWAGTHEGKSLLGQRALPAGSVIDKITTKATASNSGSGLTLGPSNNASRWVAAVAYGTSKKVHTIANSGQPAGSTDDANEHDLLLDPDTANYTGSIQVNVSYEVTEGNP